MALRINLNDIQSINDKDIFLDTNIWIYLFGSFSNSQESIVNKYSRVFKYLVQSDNRLYTDITVLSEFINRCQRHKFGIYKENNNKGKRFDFKKDYKKTGDFKETLQQLSSTVKNKILKRTSVANPQYEKKDIEDLIGNLEDRSIDFNDLHIEKLCKEKNLILLTHDGDYADSTIDIISGNPRLVPHVRMEQKTGG